MSPKRRTRSTRRRVNRAPWRIQPIRCLFCAYDVGTNADVCPECGAEIDDDHRRLARVRRSFDHRARVECGWHALIWLMLMGGIGLAMVITSSLARQLAFAAAALTVLGLLPGVVCALLVPRIHRRVVLIGWLRAMWWMHAIWVLACALVGGLLLVALADVSLGWHGYLSDGFTLFVFGLNLTALLLFSTVATRTSRSTMNRWWPEWADRRQRRAMTLEAMKVGLLVLAAGAAVLSFVIFVRGSIHSIEWSI